MTAWRAILPKHLAIRQEWYDRRILAWRMKTEAKMTYKEIGREFGISRSAAHALVCRGEKSHHRPSPVEEARQ